MPWGEGWTYLIQSVNGGPVKIGSTTRPPIERLKALQVASADELRIVGLFPDTHTETVLHDRFAGRRIRGEWFDETVLGDVDISEPLARVLCGESLLRTI